MTKVGKISKATVYLLLNVFMFGLIVGPAIFRLIIITDICKS